jgi:hypothetical protein
MELPEELVAIATRCASDDARIFLEALQTHPNFAAVMELLAQVEGALSEEHIAQALLDAVKSLKG